MTTADEDLLIAWRDGTPDAGAELVQRHGKDLAGFFHHRAPRDAIADLVQDTLATLCASRDRIRQHSSFRAFMFGVARRKLLEHGRKRQRASLSDEFSESGWVGASDDPSAGTVLDAKLRTNVVVVALRRLPLDDQLLLELSHYQGLKRREIAEVLDTPISVIGGRLYRAREKLQRLAGDLSANPAGFDSTETSLRSYWSGLRQTEKST